MSSGSHHTGSRVGDVRSQADRTADHVLDLIASQIRHAQAHLRRVVARVFMLPTPGPERPTGTEAETTLRVGTDDLPALTAWDLEQYAPRWCGLIPHEAGLRARIVHGLATRFGLDPAQMPRTADALALDDPGVQAAYQGLFDAPLDDLPPPPAPTVPDTTTAPDHALLYALARELEWVTLARGETLLRQGEVGDSLYVVTHGRLYVVVTRDDGDESIVARLGRWETVGEMAIITGEPRSATVIAARDTELIRLSRAALNRLAETHPHLPLALARSTIARMGRSQTQAAQVRRPRLATLALVPLAPDVPLARVAAHLVHAMSATGPALLLTADIIDQHVGHHLAQTPRTGSANSRLLAWLNERETDHQTVIYQADYTWTEWTQRCLRQADRVLLIAWAQGSPALSPIESAYRDQRGAGPHPRQELLLIHDSATLNPQDTRLWLDRRSVARHHHVRLEDADDYARVARFLSGRALGAVFSGGGARGFAHTGVIRALAELGLPVDMVGGTSSGALAAAGLALDLEPDQIVELSRRLFFDKRAAIDPTLPVVSLMGAHKLVAAINEGYGERHIEDLPLPFFCVSSNLSRSEMVVHRRGLLRRALRASTSLPGVYPPVAIDGELHVDGAVLNNLPTDIMGDLVEGGPVLGFDVGTDMRHGAAYAYPDSLPPRRLLARRMARGDDRTTLPDMMTILVQATTLASSSARPLQEAGASLIVNLPLDDFGMLEFKRFDEMVERGYRATLEHVGAWLAESAHPPTGDQ